MSFNKVGKFEGMRILKEFDQTLMELYGINMTDAEITRMEALAEVQMASGVREAVDKMCLKRGLPLLKKDKDAADA